MAPCSVPTHTQHTHHRLRALRLLLLHSCLRPSSPVCAGHQRKRTVRGASSGPLLATCRLGLWTDSESPGATLRAPMKRMWAPHQTWKHEEKAGTCLWGHLKQKLTLTQACVEENALGHHSREAW